MQKFHAAKKLSAIHKCVLTIRNVQMYMCRIANVKTMPVTDDRLANTQRESLLTCNIKESPHTVRGVGVVRIHRFSVSHIKLTMEAGMGRKAASPLQ